MQCISSLELWGEKYPQIAEAVQKAIEEMERKGGNTRWPITRDFDSALHFAGTPQGADYWRKIYGDSLFNGIDYVVRETPKGERRGVKTDNHYPLKGEQNRFVYVTSHRINKYDDALVQGYFCDSEGMRISSSAIRIPLESLNLYSYENKYEEKPELGRPAPKFADEQSSS